MLIRSATLKTPNLKEREREYFRSSLRRQNTAKKILVLLRVDKGSASRIQSRARKKRERKINKCRCQLLWPSLCSIASPLLSGAPPPPHLRLLQSPESEMLPVFTSSTQRSLSGDQPEWSASTSTRSSRRRRWLSRTSPVRSVNTKWVSE